MLKYDFNDLFFCSVNVRVDNAQLSIKGTTKKFLHARKDFGMCRMRRKSTDTPMSQRKMNCHLAIFREINQTSVP